MILTTYQVKSEIDCDIAIVSDLHERNPKEVLSILEKCKPDIICCPGDFIERTDIGHDPRLGKDYSRVSYVLQYAMHILNNILFRIFQNEGDPTCENAYAFFRGCQTIAPVVYSYGNHEYYLTEEDEKVMGETNVTVLHNQSAEVNGIIFGGLSPKVDEEWLSSFSEQKGFKILLCHHPEFYEKYLEDKDIDLILSGHAHGGQVRLFDRGLFSPSQGIFPRYTKGIYHGRLVVSAGSSNTAAFPRLNNPCEVVCLQLRKK